MRTSHPQPFSHLRPQLLRWRSLFLLAAVSLQLGCRSGDSRVLPTGSHPLAGGEVHRYPVPLAAGQLLRIVVAEEGIDVMLRLRDPSGREVVHVDGPKQPHENEDLAAVAERTGLYHLEVSAGGKEAKRIYRIVRVERRPAGEAERARVRAVHLTQDAAELMLKHDEASLRRQIAAREEALAIWLRLGEKGYAAATLYQMGNARSKLGETAQGAKDLEQAAVLWRAVGTEVGARGNAADALNWAGLIEKALDKPQQAIFDYKQALTLLDGGAERDRLLESKILSNLGSSYTDLSDIDEARRRYLQALAVAGPKALAAPHNNLGLLYASLGDWDQALGHYQQALKAAKGDKSEMAKTYNNQGLAQRWVSEAAKARDSFRQAVELAKEIEDRETQAQAIANLAYLEIDLHRPDQAVRWCRQALALAAGDPEIEASAWTAMGAALRELGDLKGAEAALDRALKLSRKRGNAVREANVLLNLARLARDRGDLAEAVNQAGQAIELVESLRIRVASPDLRASFLGSVQSYYEFAVDTQMALHQDAAALSASERARARSFLDLLANAGTNLRQGIPPDLVERKRQASEAVSVAEGRRARLSADPRSDPKAVAEAIRARNEAIEKYQQVEEEVRASSPSYASQIQPVTLPEIQKLLDDGTLLLEYSLGEERSYLWAVTATEIRSYTLPKRSEIEEVARRFYDQITLHSPERRSDATELAQADVAAAKAAHELAQKILAPAAGLLGDRRLLVVSDGALQYVPFAALPDPAATTASYLVERHEIVSLSSASVLSVLRRQLAQRPPPPKSLAVLADAVFEPTDERVDRSLFAKIRQLFRRPSPPVGEPQDTVATRDCSSQIFRRLRFSREEADDIARLVAPRETVYEALGFNASRSRVIKGMLSPYGMVHFATHGCIDDQHPELSGLVLSLVNSQGQPQDGILRLKDIYDLRLNVDLVVLSACQTALGKEIRGEGLIGLTRGFFYAGSARVLASLWKVDDRATAKLMTRFYGSLLGREPQRAAAALRQAQLDMARGAGDPRWRSPYYWAAFSLQGEWR